jgi:hypothetical protein
VIFAISAVTTAPLVAVLTVETIFGLNTGQPLRSSTVQRQFATVAELLVALNTDDRFFPLKAGHLVAIFTVETIFAFGTVGQFAAFATELLITLVTDEHIVLQTSGLVALFTAE